MEQAPFPAPAASPAPAPADPPGPGEVLSAATSVTLDNAGLILGLWLACGLPPQLIGFVVGLSTGLSNQNSIRDAISSQNYGALGALAVVAVVGLAFGLVGYTATVVLTSRALRGEPNTVGGVLLEALRRMIPMLIASIVTGVAVGFGFVFFFVPGMYLMIRLSMALAAVVVEGRGPIESMSRSWSLTAGRFWGTAIVVASVIAVAFFAMIGVVTAGFIFRLATSLLGPAGGLLGGLVVNALQFVVSAWAAACMTMYFLGLADSGPAA